jgi:hypothetical protein
MVVWCWGIEKAAEYQQKETKVAKEVHVAKIALEQDHLYQLILYLSLGSVVSLLLGLSQDTAKIVVVE